MDKTSVLEALAGWSVEDQLEVAVDIRRRLVERGWVPDSSGEQMAEIERRLTAAEADPENVVTWDEIVSRVKALS